MTGRDPKVEPGAGGDAAAALRPAMGPARVRFEPPLVLQGGDLGAFLRERFPFARVAAVEYLEEGSSHSNYRVELAWPDDASVEERPATVRLRLSRSDEAALREGALAERLAARLPGRVPPLLATGRGGLPEPHRRLLLGWLPGASLGERAVRPPGDRCATELGQLLARLHAEPLPAFGRLDVRGNPAGALRRWPDELTRMVGARLARPAHGLSAQEVERVRVGFARRLAPLWGGPAIPAALVHGDLSPGNVIVTPDAAGDAGPGLSGLVDWERARSADPALELAGLRLAWRGALAPLAGRVEAVYLDACRADGGHVADWERRVALASVPLLLDARAHARCGGARGALEELDMLLARALAGPEGVS